MGKKDDGGPAFPTNASNYSLLDSSDWGMSFRDYLAAQAMQGILAASGTSEGEIEYDEEILAESAYLMADAMLKERNR